jgi:glutathione S-transferase
VSSVIHRTIEELLMKLYYAAGTCSLAVHIALREVGASFDTVAVDLATHTTAGGADYTAISPRGYVPLLEFDDGSRHTEGAALLQYVADLDPAQALIGPVRSERRQRVLEWLAFVATELHKPFGWLWHKETAESTRQAVKDKLALRFAELDAHLAGRDFLEGAFSVADAYGFAVVNWCRYLAIPLTKYPDLEAWLGRVAARPRVRDAMAAEGLLK